MNEWGKVIALKGKTAILSIQRSKECEQCRKCRLGRGEQEMVGEARNKIGAEVGDMVEVGDQAINWSERLLIETGIPLTDGIAGAIIGYILAKVFNVNTSNIIWITVTAIIFIIISYVISRKQLIEVSNLKTKKLVINSIIHKEG